MEEIFILFFIELLFWGLLYGTGSLLTPVISVGFVKPEKIESSRKLRKEIVRSRWPLLYHNSGTTFLRAEMVAIVGSLFWLIVVISAMVYAGI